jgi:hypothetical protein
LASAGARELTDTSGREIGSFFFVRALIAQGSSAQDMSCAAHIWRDIGTGSAVAVRYLSKYVWTLFCTRNKIASLDEKSLTSDLRTFGE